MVRKKLGEAEDVFATTNRKLEDALAERESSPLFEVLLSSQPAHYVTVDLVGKEKADILREIKESNSAELTKVRDEWDSLTQRIHHLEAEVDASQTLAREVCAERDELRGMLDSKQAEFRAEDEESLNEMQALLAEFSALTNGDAANSTQKSSTELLKQFAELTEKNAERLAKRAEVSSEVSLYA